MIDFDELSRRRFLEFMGKSSALAAFGGLNLFCTNQETKSPGESNSLPFNSLKAQSKDQLILAEGFNYDIVLKWNQPLNKAGETFGYDNDYIAFFPLKKDEAILWVNHEFINPILMSGWDGKRARTKAEVEEEMRAVGGSLNHLKKEDGKWKLVADSIYNRRISALTPIPFHGGTIRGSKQALGTLGNCAGGVTPWKTVLTAEENYHLFYGEVEFTESGERKMTDLGNHFHWPKFHNNPPEHYGWITEVDPRTGESKKHLKLGRFAHECATCTLAQDGRVVVYSGDDKVEECLYKFISKSSDNLDEGTLYVANTEKGEWLPLDVEVNPTLKNKFKTQIDLLIRTREAAHLVGATPLDRPEDVEIDPSTQDVYVTTTQNTPAGRIYGSILKIQEAGGDAGAIKFKATTFINGGPETGFACPDNMVFDPNGNLWVTMDVSEKDLAKPEFSSFGNNGLFYIPMQGADAGKVFRIASAPIDAELTGPCFSDDGKTLFLSVQHPGGSSPSRAALTSHWPGGGQTLPQPAVVAISGPSLDALTS